MTRTALLVLALSFVSVHGQSGQEFLRMAPAWKVGQVAQFEVSSTTRITIPDAEPISMEVASNGVLEVADRVEAGYVLTYKTPPQQKVDMSMDMGVSNDTLQAIMDSVRSMMGRLIDPFLEVPISYVVSAEGEVLDLHDQASLMQRLSRALHDGMKQFLPDSLKGRITQSVVDSLLDSRFDDMLAVQVNHMNVLFMGHLVDFPSSGSYRERTLIEDVNAPILEGSEPIHGWVEMKVVENGRDRLTGQVELVYDKEELAKAMKARYPESKIDLEQLDVREVRTFTFDKHSGWITRVTELITFATPEMSGRVTTNTKLSLKRP